MKRVLVLLSVAAAFAVAPAQQRWEKYYGTQYNDWANTVTQTHDGGYAAAGVCYDGIWLLRLDSLGDTLWTRVLGQTMVHSLIQTTDSGFAMTGYAPGANDDVLLIRTDALGDTLWTRLYGGAEYDWGNCVRSAPGGGLVVAGWTTSYGMGGPDFYLIRINDNGDTLWTRTYGGPNGDECYFIEPTDDGGYLLAGKRNVINYNDQVYLVKVDSLGERLWTKYFGGFEAVDDRASCARQTDDGGYLVVASTYSFGQMSQVWVLRLDSLGDTLWTRVYGGAQTDEPCGVVLTPDGGAAVGGTTYSFGAGGYDVWLLRLDAQGDTLWTRTFGGTSDDNGYGLARALDGGFIICGRTTSYGAGYDDVYLVKTDSRGSSAIEETPAARPRPADLDPTIVHGVLFIEARGDKREARSELLDISGRKVLDLRPGPNDVGRLAPGVYFACSSIANRQSTISKVVITG